eukprot:gene47058-22422_t
MRGATNGDVRAWMVPAVDGRSFTVTAPLANLSGACNLSAISRRHSMPAVPQWTRVTAETVRPMSASPRRPVGIVMAYVGGTPVGAWSPDADGDRTCNVPPSDGANVPCDRAKAACPASLWNEFIAPVFASGGGYHRTRAQYACQFEGLIRGWRYDVAEAGLGATGMANNMDGCHLHSAAWLSASDWDGQKHRAAQSCNLHPGVVAGRLADKLRAAAYGAENASPRPEFAAATHSVAPGGASVTVTFALHPGPGGASLRLVP